MSANLDWLLQRSKKLPLLTAEQEIECSRIIQGYLKAKKPTSQRFRWHYVNAKETLIKHNIRLVCTVIPRYIHRTTASYAVEDLFADGMLGLERAAMKFDYSRGYKFSTYATTWIRSTMGRASADSSRAIRLPAHAPARPPFLGARPPAFPFTVAHPTIHPHIRPSASVSLTRLPTARPHHFV